MKERPILFSAPMVRAILESRKTQTRRVVKQNLTPLAEGSHMYQFDHRGINYRTSARTCTTGAFSSLRQFCPYGQPGDRLWVRETFAIEHQIESDQPPPHNDGRPIKLGEDFGGTEWRQCHYRATDPAPDLMYEDHPRDEPHCRWTPSIHMPRWASRITLEITGVRVERLNEITPADALAEGVFCPEIGYAQHGERAPVGGFASLWESINGHGSWEANPWVWAVSFTMITP